MRRRPSKPPLPDVIPDRTVLLIVASAMFMEQLDGTVLATALPTMARTFNADPLHMNVALTSYLLTLAISSLWFSSGAARSSRRRLSKD